MPLPTGMFDTLRRVVEDVSPDSAVVKRVTPTSDGHGGWTDAETTIATVACKVAALGATRPSESAYADRLQGEAGVEITLPAGTDVRANDRIVVNATTTYDVVGVVPTRTYEVRKRVVAVLIQ